MFRVIVQDFGMIKNVDLTVEGIVCIVGTTGSGKSTLLQAMQAAIYNQSGNEFIRTPDCTTAKVGLYFDEQEDNMGGYPALAIVWEKGMTGSGTYKINGKVLTKSGRSAVPEILQQGFEELKANDESYQLNFWHQSQSFLVDRPRTHLFNVFSNFMNERQLIPVLRELKADIAKKTGTSLNLEGQGQALSKSLSQMRAKLLQTEEISQIGERLPIIESFIGEIERKTEIQNVLESALKNKNVLEDTLKKYTFLQGASETMREVTSVVESVRSRTSVAEKLRDLISTESTLRQQIDKYVMLQSARELDVSSVLDRAVRAQKTHDALESAIIRSRTVETELLEVTSALASAQELKSEFERVYKVCPTCRKPFDEEHVECSK